VDENLKHLGALLGSEQQAATLASDYHRQLQGLQDKIKQAQASQKAPGVLLLVGHAGAKPLIAGQVPPATGCCARPVRATWPTIRATRTSRWRPWPRWTRTWWCSPIAL
jgi:hypothetical protein